MTRRLFNTEGGRFINGRQVTALVIGLAAFGAMLLFPPWKKEHWRLRSTLIWFSERDKLIDSEFAGYDYAFADKPYWQKPPNGGSNNGEEISYTWHLGLLSLQCVILSLAVGGTCWALRDRRTVSQRIGQPSSGDS